MGENNPNTLGTLINEAGQQLSQQVKAQAEQMERLEQTLNELRAQQRKLEETLGRQLESLEQAQAALPPPAAPQPSLEKVLGAVRNLITATLPEQVLDVLTEEAEQAGVRAAVFDVRGKSAWGASARGFGPGLSEKALRGLVVPLNQDNPFRQVYETGGHVDANADMLRKNRNILDKLKPGPEGPILLLPIRSAGSVSAIFYADPGSRGAPLPVDALKILAEFAGAQLDRLMALSGGMAAEAAPEARAPVEEEPAVMEATEVPVEAVEPEPAAAVVAEPELTAQPAPEPPAMPPAAFDASRLSEEEQKVHKDAKRFAKLLISEIELYNKSKVADGRKNGDLYKRLKADIERSRQTYQKRFAKTGAKQVDYFHEELVRVLANSDASLLGPEYPGPAA